MLLINIFYNTAVGIIAEGILMHTTAQQSRDTTLGLLALMGFTVVDTIFDTVGFAKVTGVNPTWTWLLAGLVALAVCFTEPLMEAVHNRFQPAAIEPDILRRWEMVCGEFGIHPDESRADITQFPAVLAQIQQAEAARLSCSVRATRVALGERVMVLMREALGPLDAELEYLQQAALPVAIPPTYQQAVQDAAAALLVETPI